MTSNSYQTQTIDLPDEYSIRQTPPLATTREWVMALNPAVLGELLKYPQKLTNPLICDSFQIHFFEKICGG